MIFDNDFNINVCRFSLNTMGRYLKKKKRGIKNDPGYTFGKSRRSGYYVKSLDDRGIRKQLFKMLG